MRGLDTYVGRTIVRTDTDSDGNWFIELEGGIRIVNNDGRRTLAQMPNGGVGLLFTTVILDENQTQMVFSDATHAEWRQAFTPAKYQIADENQSWTPQVEEAPIEIPPHPDERIAEGPEPQEETNEE